MQEGINMSFLKQSTNNIVSPIAQEMNSWEQQFTISFERGREENNISKACFAINVKSEGYL